MLATDLDFKESIIRNGSTKQNQQAKTINACNRFRFWEINFSKWLEQTEPTTQNKINHLKN